MSEKLPYQENMEHTIHNQKNIINRLRAELDAAKAEIAELMKRFGHLMGEAHDVDQFYKDDPEADKEKP